MMPVDDRRFLRLTGGQLVQLVALVLVLPVQYFLTNRSTEVYRQYELHKLFSNLRSLGSNMFNISWIRWCCEKLSILDNSGGAHSEPDIIPKDKTSGKGGGGIKDENFGLSLEPRYIRAPNVLYKVGQVVRHKNRGFIGVIIGWDEKVKAPKEWLEQVRPDNKPKWNEEPNYAVLVDIRSAKSIAPQVAYVVQENLETIENTRVLHPLLDSYFEYFYRDRYVMRPWLKKIYPRDHL